MNKTEKLESALDYAERGWPVIPVRVAGGKEFFPSWKTDPGEWPTVDPEDVSHRWSQEGLDSNPAICIGPGTTRSEETDDLRPQAPLIVLDWDAKNAPARFRQDPDPRAVTRKMVEAIEEELGPLPETLTAVTGSGGEHRYFQRPPALERLSRSNLGNFRLEGALEVALGNGGAGKLLFAPPTDRRSVKESHDRVYQWVDPDAHLAELPDAWVEAILEAATDDGGPGNGFQLPEGEIHEGKGPYGGRDNTLWKYAGHLWKKGVAPAHMLDALRRVNERCVPPLDDDELQDKIERTVRNGEPGHTHGYRATPHGLRLLKLKDGEVDSAEVLTNFTAEILRDTTVDDGASRTREFQLRAFLEGRPYDVTVEAQTFEEMKWPIQEIGATAVVEPYKNGKARAAIQHLSPSVDRHLIFAHTGWRRVEGEWLYLFHGGAIGGSGLVESVDVRLPDALSRYHLPAPPEGKALQSAVAASLDLLDLLPDRVMVPALAAVAAAPLGEAEDTNYSLFLEGATGSFKTTLAALLQGFFGNFEATALPASWSSTANALERLLSAAKDTLLVVDDYAPDGTHRGTRAMQRKADQVLRGAANRQARQRLTSTTDFRETYVQRGLPVVTGEQVPQGESLRARFYAIRMRAEEMDTRELTKAQDRRDDGVYRRAIAGYVRWLATRLDDLTSSLSDDREELRDMWQLDVVQGRVHRRTVDLCARLAVALDTYLSFAEDAGVDLSRYARGRRPLRAWMQDVLKRRALGTSQQTGDQTDYHDQENPGARFQRVLRSALATGRAYVKNAESPDKAPTINPTSLGWEPKSIPSMRNGFGHQPARRAEHVGWVDTEYLYLNREAAYAVAARLARETGLQIPGNVNSLLQDMKDRGQLAAHEDGRTQKRKQINNSRQYYVWLSTAEFLDVEPEEVPDEHARIMAADANAEVSS